MSNVKIFSRRVYNEYSFIGVNQDISRHANDIKKDSSFYFNRGHIKLWVSIRVLILGRQYNSAASLLVVYFGPGEIILLPLDSSSKFNRLDQFSRKRF